MAPSPSPPRRPASPPTTAVHTQALSAIANNNHTQAGGAAGAASGLSLGLPHSSGQGGSLGITPLSAPLSSSHGNVAIQGAAVVNSVQGPAEGTIGLARVKLAEMLPEDGAASVVYMRAVESLSISLARNNAAIVELNGEDAALVRCALESAKLYFRSRGQAAASWTGPDWTKSTGYLAAPSRDMYFYRAGRTLQGEDPEPPPPCMPEVFRCLGKASRASLSAISRHLRLRGDVFGSLLDDSPLPPGEISSSFLTATSFHAVGPGSKGLLGDSAITQEVEKGLLMLIASDTPGLQVCDPSGRWYLADNGVGPGDLVLLTGRALQQATAGLRRASAYRVAPLAPTSMSAYAGRTSLAFRLMPRGSATIDCSPLAEAGHTIPEGYGPLSVAAFMDNLNAAEVGTNGSDLDSANTNAEPTLRNALSDPLTGALLEDAMAAPCGHSFGAGTLRRVYDSMACISCGSAVDASCMIQNLALRAAAAAFKREERSRQMHAGSVRGTKRKKEPGEQADPSRLKRPNKDHPHSPTDKDNMPRIGGKGVQYPFSVNERVMIKGNKRTPEKFVGREASITSQCLNGWYLVRTLDNGESVRLQYRSLAKAVGDHNGVSDDAHVPSNVHT